jgi:DNA-binding response OmpR family regulator
MSVGDDLQNVVQTCCVFVVDENETTRAALRFMLLGYSETHEMASVEAALVTGKQWRPDLVIVSALLVARSDLVLLHQLRAVWPGVKLLVICEAAEDECHAAALAAGADDTLMRPFMVDAVRRKMDRLLGRQQDEPRHSADKRLTLPHGPAVDHTVHIGHH